MQNLEFNTGMIELAIQGDPNRVLRFNPTDEHTVVGFLNLFKGAQQKISELAVEEGLLCAPGNGLSGLERTEKKNELWLGADKFLRDEIDKLFGQGTSEMVFGKLSSVALTSSGETVFMAFMSAMLPHITKDITVRNERIRSAVQKYKPQR